MINWVTISLVETFSSNYYVILLVTVVLLGLYFYYQRKSSQNIPLPPGPWGLPLLGYLPWIPRATPYLHMMYLHKKYGPLISFYLGRHLTVVLGTYDIIKEAYVTQGDVFAGKPRYSPMEIDGDERGLSVSDGPLWREQRRFLLKTFKDYGVGKQSLEPAIKEEIYCFLQELKQISGEKIDLRHRLGTSISNNICSLEFGKRFEYTDPDFLRIKNLLDQLTMKLDLIPTQMFFNWLRKVPGTNLFMNYGILKKRKRDIYEFIKKIVNNHEVNFESEEHRDLIFAWFDETLERFQRNPHDQIFTRDNLLFNLLSLFVAGSQTVTSTLLTGIYYLAKLPEVQEKCQKEIYDIIGNDRLPSLSDRPHLPYVEATLLEIQRIVTVNPMSLVHRVMETTVLCGFRIPKDTVVYSNQYAVHYDPERWPEPNEFRPERFLNERNEIINQDKIIPFSIGKRTCLGISLAKTELFLYFSAFVQNFEFLPPTDGDFQVDFLGQVVRTPAPFQVRPIFLDTPVLKGFKES